MTAPIGGSVRAAVQPIGNALQQPAAHPCPTRLEQRADIGRLNKHSLGADEPKRVDSIGAWMNRPAGGMS